MLKAVSLLFPSGWGAHAAEVAAGLAVAEGALIAGPLEKRSDWLRSWNKRFCVLTTEQLAWHEGAAMAAASTTAIAAALFSRKVLRRSAIHDCGPRSSRFAGFAAERSTAQLDTIAISRRNRMLAV